MTKTLLKAVALVLCMSGCFVASASTEYQVIDELGNKVKRIIFDREHVTFVYDDGTTRDYVKQALVTNAQATSVETINATTTAEREVYDLQGRRISNVENMPSGIFIVRQGDKVYKLIKK